MDLDKAAALLGTTRAKATSRLVALGYTKVCSRCLGSGRFSWNRVDGDRCFGCSGSGKKLASLTETLVAEAKARIEAGELAGYFAKNAARAKIKKAAEKATATWRGSFVATTYTKLSCGPTPAATVVKSPEFRAVTLVNAIWDLVNRIERGARGTTDPIGALAKIEACEQMLVEVDEAFKMFVNEHGLTEAA